MRLRYRRILLALVMGLGILFSTLPPCFSQLPGKYYLAYPPRPGIPDSFRGGPIDLAPRDSFESCHLSFYSNGPIVYYVDGLLNPSFLTGRDNMYGSVHVDTNSVYFPPAADSAQAALVCNYTITYSSPLNPLSPPKGILGGATDVYQTPGTPWNCYGSPSAPCKAGHIAPAAHTLVTETGKVKFEFVVFAAALKDCPLPDSKGKIRKYDPAKEVCCCDKIPVDKNRKPEEHHIATNKGNSEYKKKFEAIAKEFGLSTDDKDWNVIPLPPEYHCSRKHPESYHKFVLEGMEKAAKEAKKKPKKDQADEFKKLFKKYVTDKLLKEKDGLKRICGDELEG